MNMDLLNLKSIQAETFSSKEGGAWKPWAKRTKLYLDGKVQGFRSAISAAERMTEEIPAGPSHFTDWPMRGEADKQPHTFLLHQTQGRALQIAEEPGIDGRGFEAWRRMKEEFEPKGGAYEMKVMQCLMSPSKSKNLASLYDDIRQWETRIFKWEQRTGRSHPGEFKLPGLHLMIPEDFKEDSDRRFTLEAHDCDTARSALKTYAQQNKMQKDTT